MAIRALFPHATNSFQGCTHLTPIMSCVTHPPQPAGIAQAQFSHAWDVEHAQIVSRTNALVTAMAVAFQEY
jgi:hypothetical protein